MTATGLTEEAAKAHAEKLGPMMYIYGLLITLVQVLGINYVLNQAGASVLATCAKIGALLAILISVPIMLYRPLYEGGGMGSIGIDIPHILIGYVLAGVVLSFFRGQDAIAK